MTIAELLINHNDLMELLNDYEHRLSLLSSYGTDDEVSLMEEVLEDYVIE